MHWPITSARHASSGHNYSPCLKTFLVFARTNIFHLRNERLRSLPKHTCTTAVPFNHASSSSCARRSVVAGRPPLPLPRARLYYCHGVVLRSRWRGWARPPWTGPDRFRAVLAAPPPRFVPVCVLVDADLAGEVRQRGAPLAAAPAPYGRWGGPFADAAQRCSGGAQGSCSDDDGVRKVMRGGRGGAS